MRCESIVGLGLVPDQISMGAIRSLVRLNAKVLTFAIVGITVQLGDIWVMKDGGSMWTDEK